MAKPIEICFEIDLLDLHASDPERYPFLLESAGRDPRFGRFSFAGCSPFERIGADGGPDAIRDALVRHALPAESSPTPLPAGAVGFLSYDCGRRLERIPAALLFLATLALLTGWTLDLAAIEALDAWNWKTAGTATLTIAVVGLAASRLIETVGTVLSIV